MPFNKEDLERVLGIDSLEELVHSVTQDSQINASGDEYLLLLSQAVAAKIFGSVDQSLITPDISNDLARVLKDIIVQTFNVVSIEDDDDDTVTTNGDGPFVDDGDSNTSVIARCAGDQ
ncbi:MAG: hypothetical protein K0T99_00250, partial [Alphaproteobacteria bacterium]|nr:hypothetical protein [Alphaproteobacteria bacterium]